VKIPQPIAAEPWPEADRLFHQDPRWLGSDDAYSVALSGDRTLWLFGDTFVAPTEGLTRRECAFVRNSIGIQQGRDPATSKMNFYWGTDGGVPSDYFPIEDGWLWPLHGVLLSGNLLLFFMKVRSPRPRSGDGIDEWKESDSLSFFEVYGWTAFAIRDAGSDPLAWKLEELETPENDLGIVIGAGVLTEDEWLYSWGWTQGRDGYLVKWRQDACARGDLSALQWWRGPGYWGAEPKPEAVALPNAQTEFVVYRHSSGLLFQLQAIGLNSADLTIRWSDGPEGPWTEPHPFYRLPESERDGVIAYAGKAHPQLEGSDLVCTYASNGDSAQMTIDDESIYYPRFVKVQLSVP
jgi:hypothetical protein